MRHFAIFLAVLIFALLGMPHMHFFKKTQRGQRYEYFQTETSQVLPPILAKYLRESGARYTVYKIPNYVRDFFTYNKDFSIVYKTKPRCSVVIFLPSKTSQDYVNYKIFYEKFQAIIKNYSKYFNVIIRDDAVAPLVIQQYERDAYKDFKSYCVNFCIVNPSNNTMFVFNKTTFTEVQAVEAVLQHYSYIYESDNKFAQ